MVEKPSTDGDPGMKKRFAFIGCGRIAPYHADVLLALGHQIIAAAARPGSKNLEPFCNKYGVKKRYDDYRVLLKELKPDGIILCTSCDQTESILSSVIEANCPVLVEKPAALSLENHQRSVGSAAARKENILVGYNRRFYDFVPDLRSKIREGTLRSVEMILPEATSHVRESGRSVDGDSILFYLSSHWVDLALYLLGGLELIHVERSLDEQGKIRSYHGLLRGQRSKVPVHYISDFDAYRNTSLVFTFDDSVWQICPGEVLSVYDRLIRKDPTAERPYRRYEPQLLKKVQTDCVFKPGFYKQMKYFIDACVLHESKEKIGCTLDDSLKLTICLEAIKGMILSEN